MMALLGLVTFSFEVFVVMKLWGWFAVPYLHVPSLGYGPMFGLWVMSGLIITQYTAIRIDRLAEESEQRVVIQIFQCVFALLIGWITHCLMEGRFAW